MLKTRKFIFTLCDQLRENKKKLAGKRLEIYLGENSIVCESLFLSVSKLRINKSEKRDKNRHCRKFKQWIWILLIFACFFLLLPLVNSCSLYSWSLYSCSFIQWIIIFCTPNISTMKTLSWKLLMGLTVRVHTRIYIENILEKCAESNQMHWFF